MGGKREGEGGAEGINYVKLCEGIRHDPQMLPDSREGEVEGGRQERREKRGAGREGGGRVHTPPTISVSG